MFVSCSAPPPATEEELFVGGSAYFEEENYRLAIESYEELIEQFPFSDYAESASLEIAHAYYLTAQYQKAVASFQDFERLYPVSPRLSFVEYVVGMCYLERALAQDRDQSASENALRQFSRISARYPGTVFARLADHRVDESRERLAAHELYVGDYYFERGKVEAARLRYAYVVRHYSDTESASSARVRIDSLPELDDEIVVPDLVVRPASIVRDRPSGGGGGHSH